MTSLPGVSARSVMPPDRVALFATCLADFAASGLISATVEVLEAMGVDVDFPSDQTCCGQPALNSGFPKEAGRVMRQTLDSLEGAQAVVTPAGSCAAMIAHNAVRLLGPDAGARSGVRHLWLGDVMWLRFRPVRVLAVLDD